MMRAAASDKAAALLFSNSEDGSTVRLDHDAPIGEHARVVCRHPCFHARGVPVPPERQPDRFARKNRRAEAAGDFAKAASLAAQ